MTGYGEYFWAADGAIYIGDLVKGKKHGKGSFQING